MAGRPLKPMPWHGDHMNENNPSRNLRPSQEDSQGYYVHDESLGPLDHRIKNVLDYIHANVKNKLLLNDLARIALLSPCHLLRVFKKVVGMTPKAYLLHLRVERTRQLLRLGKSVSEIVALTGFTDTSHLARTFKALTGMTPRDFNNHPR